ncbi:sirohydrochlorin chelatase, partial [Streptomyces carpinensis]
MTVANPPRDESFHGPGGPPTPGVRLDSTAHIMSSIGAELAGRLSLVALDGRRRPAPPALVLVAHGSRDPRALSTVRALMDRVRELRPRL